MKPFPALVD